MSLGRREMRGDSGAAAGDEALREPMRRVVEALLDGAPPSPTDQAALTDDERAELASLLRTAHLTRVAIQAETPNPAAEEASLSRAQSDLQKRVASGTLPAVVPTSATRDKRPTWLDRLLGRDGGSRDE